MARPFKQGLSYFPHDTDAHNDDKVQALMALYGTEGYAFYFILLEKVFRTENGRITCGSVAIKAGLAKSIGITAEKFNIILATALEIGCFNAEIYKKENVLTSNGIEKRVISVNTLRLKERERKDKDKDKRKRKAKTGKPTENSRKTLEGKKPPTNPDIKIFIDYTFSSYKEKTGNKLLITGKDAKLVESLLPVYPLAELKALWEKFLVSEDKFIKQAGFSFGVFYSQINKLQNQKEDWRST